MSRRALATAAWTVDRVYRTQSVHHGYLEPQACIADYRRADSVRIWLTNKAPYRIRDIIAACLGLDAAAITLEPVTLGGDFGGKGSAQDAPLCVELSRLTGRPVKLVLRYAEDLTSTNPRHPAEIRVRLGCDHAGRLVAASLRAVLNAGAYGGFTPNVRGPQHAIEVPVLPGTGVRHRVHPRLHEYGAARQHARAGRAAGDLRVRVGNGRACRAGRPRPGGAAQAEPARGRGGRHRRANLA